MSSGPPSKPPPSSGRGADPAPGSSGPASGPPTRPASEPPTGPPSGPLSGAPLGGPPSGVGEDRTSHGGGEGGESGGQPPSGHGPSGASGAPWYRRPVSLVAAVLAAALAATLAVVLSSGQASAQVQLQPADSSGPNPFTAPVTKATPSAAPSVTLSGTAGQSKAVSGGTTGLYGGTERVSSCDAEKMISFLASNPDKARAWAGAEGITTSEIPAYVRSLTPVLLRIDTRVTNHGFSNGSATSFQAVLQTGTAVMIDARGVPRVRCACGNPLLPPSTTSSESYTGSGWSNFNSGNVVVVVPTTVNITVVVLLDPDTGTWFGRPTGTDGGADHKMPPPTGTTPTPTQTPTATTTSPSGTPSSGSETPTTGTATPSGTSPGSGPGSATSPPSSGSPGSGTGSGAPGKTSTGPGAGP